MKIVVIDGQGGSIGKEVVYTGKAGKLSIHFIRVFDLGDHQHYAVHRNRNSFDHQRKVIGIETDFIGSLFHHVLKQSFRFFLN